MGPCLITQNDLLIGRREGVPAHIRTGSKRTSGIAWQSVFHSWAGWQDRGFELIVHPPSVLSGQDSI
jgi:hypothetical protein